MRLAVFQIGDAHIDRHGQRAMRGGQRIAVIDFAIGGVLAVEGRAVPGGDAGLVIVRLLARVIPDVVDLVGLADLVDAGIGRNRDGMVRPAGAQAGRRTAARQATRPRQIRTGNRKPRIRPKSTMGTTGR